MNLKLTRRDFLKGSAAAAAMAAFDRSPLAKVLPQSRYDALLLEPVYIGLGTGAPIIRDTGDGFMVEGVTEVSGNGYSRQEIDFVPTDTGVRNTNEVIFPQASSVWGKITHAAIFSRGELIAVAPFAGYAKFINSGDTVAINNVLLEALE